MRLKTKEDLTLEPGLQGTPAVISEAFYTAEAKSGHRGNMGRIPDFYGTEDAIGDAMGRIPVVHGAEDAIWDDVGPIPVIGDSRSAREVKGEARMR